MKLGKSSVLFLSFLAGCSFYSNANDGVEDGAVKKSFTIPPEEYFISKLSDKDLKNDSPLLAIGTVRKNTIDKLNKTIHSANSTNKSTTNSKVEIVARVNGEAITNIDVDNQSKFICFISGKPYDAAFAKIINNAVLSSEISKKIQKQFSSRAGISIPKEAVDAQFLEIAEMNGLSEDEFKKALEGYGINVDIFKKNIAAGLISSVLVDSVKDEVKLTKEEEDSTESKKESNANQNRYKFKEITVLFGDNKDAARKTIDEINDLLKKGFSFMALSDNLSQGAARSSDIWLGEASIPKDVISALKGLNIGQFSNIIETKTGYKIIFLMDKAAPGKAGQMESSYKYIKASMPYTGPMMTQADVEKATKTLESVANVTTPAGLEKILKDKGVKYEILEAEAANPITEALSQAVKNPAIVQASETMAEIYMVKEIETPDAAVVMSKEEVINQMKEQKAIELLNKRMHMLKSVALIQRN